MFYSRNEYAVFWIQASVFGNNGIISAMASKRTKVTRQILSARLLHMTTLTILILTTITKVCVCVVTGYWHYVKVTRQQPAVQHTPSFSLIDSRWLNRALGNLFEMSNGRDGAMCGANRHFAHGFEIDEGVTIGNKV